MSGTNDVRETWLWPRLSAWVRAAVPDGELRQVWKLPGHGGLSFGFAMGASDGESKAVIRLAPPGVARRRNTDLLRQVPLLSFLSRHGIPIANIIAAERDSAQFGTDVLIQQWVEGKPLHMTDARLSIDIPSAGTEPLISEAIGVLANIHALEWVEGLSEWERPVRLEDDLHHWAGLLERAHVGETITRMGSKCYRELLASMPRDFETRLFHGDFQTNNVLFDESHRLQAVIDWELAGLGPAQLDVAWLAMFLDRECWSDEYVSGMRVEIAPDRVFAYYESRTGTSLKHLPWFRAFALFRFACISSYNVRLHRTGRRIDPAWELMAGSIPVQLERARAELNHSI